MHEFIRSRGDLIEQQLSQLIPEQKVAHSSLFQAARYSLLGGGKRLRPLLTLATVEVFKKDPKAGLIPACALEMIHTYSLIHDDLPCMDDDDFRRGKPSLHKAFQEGQAVLAGDYLLTHAFQVLATAPKLSEYQRLELIRILSNRAGGEGMIAGQILDIEAEPSIDIQDLNSLHSHKTGALLVAALEFGAIIAEADEEQMEILREFGSNIGLAFQIIDDVLDVTSSKQKHGKTLSSDQINGKATYVTLMGLERSQKEAEKLLLNGLKTIEKLSVDVSLLKELAWWIVNRKL